MTHISDQIVNNAISQMGVSFDTHALIFWIMENYPREYISELNDNFIENQSPFQQLHATIGKYLTRINTIQQQGQVSSINLLGKTSTNELWRKL